MFVHGRDSSSLTWRQRASSSLASRDCRRKWRASASRLRARNRRSNLSTPRLKASSGGMPAFRARLTRAKKRSPISSAK